MDFDSKRKPLRSQEDVLDYLMRYGVAVSDEITVEWCLLKTDVKVAPPMVACSSIPISWR